MESKPFRLSRHFSLGWWFQFLSENFWNTQGSWSVFASHWRSTKHRDFTSSTRITWSITQDLKEYYTMSMIAKHNMLVFLMFSCMSQPKECVCLPSTRNASQHHGMSVKCLFCALALFYYVNVLELGACWSSLIYISCSLVYMHIFPVNHVFTNMGQPMHHWLHLKYHFMWVGPYIV